jgi:hypothetical protein
VTLFEILTPPFTMRHGAAYSVVDAKGRSIAIPGLGIPNGKLEEACQIIAKALNDYFTVPLPTDFGLCVCGLLTDECETPAACEQRAQEIEAEQGWRDELRASGEREGA